MKIKHLIKYMFGLLLLGTAVMVFSNLAVSQRAKNKLFTEVADIPKNKVGLVLGTSKYLSSGRVNLYYRYRVEAAYDLYKNGKVDFLLISGDNGRKSYNEPEMFKEDLVKLGVPAQKIYLDYAGFRTLDSVVRSKAIFGQKQITIISQKFHNERAVFISGSKDIEAVGFNAKAVDLKYGWKTRLREVLARTKMMLDLYLIHKSPKYLGEKIKIE